VAVLIAVQVGIAHGSFSTYFGSQAEVLHTLVNE